MTQERNDAGIYCVTLFVNGVSTPIIVDDYFPVKYGQPAFCKTNDGEIWAMILEKAWAKLHGSYMRTEGGQTAHASQHLLGYPAFSMDHEDEVKDTTKFMRKMMAYDKRDFVMLASTNSGTNDEFVDGIVQGHAYTILAAVKIDAHGTEWDLLAMRNPWGKSGEWTGDWSDKSDLWNDDCKEQVR